LFVKGILNEVSPIAVLKSGVKNNKPWQLFGCTLIVDGQKYSLNSFSESDLNKLLVSLTPGSFVEFECEKQGNFFVVNEKTLKQSFFNSDESKNEIKFENKKINGDNVLSDFLPLIPESLELTLLLAKDLKDLSSESIFNARKEIFLQLIKSKISNKIIERKNVVK
jgi:hypothetical protein